MLQQTRVETVDGYFRRWMGDFPNGRGAGRRRPAGGAQGVGRAGLLCARAQSPTRPPQWIVAEHGGCSQPTASCCWLPGIGAYTVGAILSIAYNQPEPILDGNVKRVLARLFDIDQPVNAPACCASCGGWRGTWSRRRRRVRRATATRR
jgi:A/G-specific adenine glycosylase